MPAGGLAPAEGATMTTKTTHTPGPWYEMTKGENNYQSAICEETTGKTVALTYTSNDADARLIAASPALLAALKNASRALTALDPLARHHDATLLDNALSQAEGGTQPF